MRPIDLEFCGINSFSEPARIDFTRLLEFGIFGIFGDTGSGKSTILDCIGFALYGSMSRSRAGSLADVINYRSDRAYVNFEFEIVFEGKRRLYRVERELKRKKDAPPVQSVRVYEREGNVLSAAADGVRDCNALLERIVGLEQKDFEKCIALPQGEFAQFVRSARSDRVKLISRLFDLERYGEGLVKRANANFVRLKGECEVLGARLEPYKEITAEKLASLKDECERLGEEARKAEAALLRAQETERALTERLRAKREAEKVAAEFSALEARKEQMKALNAELSRLERAQSAVATSREHAAAEERANRIRREYGEALARFERAEKALSSLPRIDEEKEDAEIARLTEEKARAEAAASERRRREALVKERGEAEKAKQELGGRIQDPQYERRKRELGELLSRAPEDDFICFLEKEGRAALLRGEYERFAEQLFILQEKYPVIRPDSEPLISGYKAEAQGERATFSDLKEVFMQRERANKAAHEALIALEKAKNRYEADLKELARLQETVSRCDREIALCDEKLAGAASQDAERLLLEKKRAKRERAEAREAVQKEHVAAALVRTSEEEKLRAAETAQKEAKERLFSALAAGEFGSLDEALALAEKYGDAQAAKRSVEEYREEYAAAKRRMRELEGDYSAVSEEALSGARTALANARMERETLVGKLTLLRADVARGEKDLENKRALEREYKSLSGRAETAERLKKLLEGNKFMEYVAEEYLQTVSLHASSRLLSLTEGQYFLRYNGGFFVGDNLNGGALRPVYTLSGGETFLVSLSLALSLSAEICAKSLRPIEFFFLDEGFGTLDRRLVDTVMDSLEKLKSENFAIGIISHVEELKHRIDRKLLVSKATERHGSTITTE